MAFADLNNDGNVDLVVANDTVRNFLFLGNGDGPFKGKEGRSAGVVFDTNGNAREPWASTLAGFATPMNSGLPSETSRTKRPPCMSAARSPNQLPVFQDEAISNGIAPPPRAPELTFGVFFFDSDLDGRLDIFAANGHLEADINPVQPSQHYKKPPNFCGTAVPNTTTSSWHSIPPSAAKGFTKGVVGRGASFADIDGDGDLDPLITSVGAGPGSPQRPETGAPLAESPADGGPGSTARQTEPGSNFPTPTVFAASR
ncbi:MAG: hypothetical protein Ct9H300mP1_08570 [Planctomycetaceae bacterium]|nr:MAG: hypothetical protein Ct9H300mP1_08570 [Planctomycetaceae bacterium]